MKTLRYFLIALAFISTLTTEAQEKFNLAVLGGINYPDVRGYDYARYADFKVGFLLGISVEYAFSERLSLRSDLSFERKTGKIRISYFDANAEMSGSESFNKHFDYINWPFLLKYEVGKTPFFVNGGPFLNYLLSTKYKPDYPNEELDKQVLSAQRNFDLGFTLGVGGQVVLGNNQALLIEVRNDLGLIDTGGVPLHLGGGKRMTNTLKLILGFRFNI